MEKKKTLYFVLAFLFVLYILNELLVKMIKYNYEKSIPLRQNHPEKNKRFEVFLDIIQEYNDCMDFDNQKIFAMNGTLLGVYRNKRILCFDHD